MNAFERYSFFFFKALPAKSFVLSFLLFASSLCAQDLTWSPLQKFSRDTRTFGYVASDQSGFLVMEENVKESVVTFHHYVYPDLKIKDVVEYKYGNDKGRSFEHVVASREQVMVFTSEYAKENEQFQIYCTLFNKQGKKISDAALVHYTVAESKSDVPEFGVVMSPDSSKMLLYFDPPFARKSTETLSFKCYDMSLDLLWEKEILLPYTNDIVQVHSFLIDNNSNIYMMSGENPEKDSRKWQRPMGGKYVVFFYNARDKKLKEYDLSLKDKQVVSVRFALNAAQDVIVCGYYSNDFRFSASGTFLFSITAGGGPVKAATFMPFTQDFVAKLVKASRSDDGAIPDFYLDKMFIRDDNSILLIGEQYYTSEFIITDPTTGRQTIEYRFNFDDLIATRIDQNGRHLWNAKIPKRQFTTSDTEHFSYACFDDGQNTRFYFNDHPENEHKLSAMPEGDASLWSGGRQSVTVCVELLPEGKFSRKTIVQNKERDGALSPMVGNVDCNLPEVLGYKEGRDYRFLLRTPAK
jgi:hypothetical protein